MYVTKELFIHLSPIAYTIECKFCLLSFQVRISLPTLNETFFKSHFDEHNSFIQMDVLRHHTKIQLTYISQVLD